MWLKFGVDERNNLVTCSINWRKKTLYTSQRRKPIYTSQSAEEVQAVLGWFCENKNHSEGGGEKASVAGLFPNKIDSHSHRKTSMASH